MIKNNNIDLQIENVLPDNKTLPDNSSKKIFASQHEIDKFNNKFNDNLDFIVNDNFITENLDIDQFEVID